MGEHKLPRAPVGLSVEQLQAQRTLLRLQLAAPVLAQLTASQPGLDSGELAMRAWVAAGELLQLAEAQE